MTITDVVNRVSSIVARDPFAYTVAKEPFGFTRQPQQQLHKTFCVLAGDPQVEGMFNYAQTELVPVTIRLARFVRRDAVAAYRAMLTDVSSLQSAIARDGTAGNYNADVTSVRTPEPGDDDEFIIAEIVALTDYEHAL